MPRSPGRPKPDLVLDWSGEDDGATTGRSVADAVATVSQLLLDRAPTCGTVRVLAVDGGAAAGKTTFAAAVAEAVAERRSATGDAQSGVAVVHTDDLLDGWDDQFGFWERLRTGVLEPFRRGAPAEYRRYDWNRGEFGESYRLDPPELLIVEGVSAISACEGYRTVGVLLAVPRAERARRWAARDGALDDIALRWLDREDRYFDQ